MGLGRKGNNSKREQEEIRDQKSSTGIDSGCRVQFTTKKVLVCCDVGLLSRS